MAHRRVEVTQACVVALAAAIAAACGVAADGPPEIVVDRTACSHCGMLVSDPGYAAAYRAPGGEARVFDDIGCLLEAVRVDRGSRLQADGPQLRFWLHDFAGGDWIDGRSAVFVGSPALHTPMGGGLIALRDRVAALDYAARHQGRVIESIDELMRTRTGGGSHAPAGH